MDKLTATLMSALIIIMIVSVSTSFAWAAITRCQCVLCKKCECFLAFSLSFYLSLSIVTLAQSIPITRILLPFCHCFHQFCFCCCCCCDYYCEGNLINRRCSQDGDSLECESPSEQEGWMCLLVLVSAFVFVFLLSLARARAVRRQEETEIEKKIQETRNKERKDTKNKQGGLTETWVWRGEECNLLRAIGEIMSRLARDAPLSWPTRVMLLESPPNSPILSWIQCKAAIISIRA